MTLIIAADVQDHLMLAGDHCAVMSNVSNTGAPERVIKNYRKVYFWKHGAIAASGDVVLMVWFCRLLLHHERSGQPLDLLQIARQAKQRRACDAIPCEVSTGNIFFSLPGGEGFNLYGVFIKAQTIELELIEPISTRFSMREAVPDAAACHVFNSRLRPSFFFKDAQAFQQHHLGLLGAFYAGHSAVDDRVTPSFDVILLEKRTGRAMAWQVSERAASLVSITLMGH